MKVHSTQRGMTLIGMLILLAFIGVFVLAGLKLTPLYLEYFNVKSALESTRDELSGTRPTVTSLKTAVQNRLDVNNVTGFSAADLTVVRKGRSTVLKAQYEGRAAFIGNVYLVVAFNESVEVTH